MAATQGDLSELLLDLITPASPTDTDDSNQGASPIFESELGDESEESGVPGGDCGPRTTDASSNNDAFTPEDGQPHVSQQPLLPDDDSLPPNDEAAPIRPAMSPNANYDPLLEAPPLVVRPHEVPPPQLTSPNSLTSEVDLAYLTTLPQPSTVPSNVMLHMTLQHHQQTFQHQHSMGSAYGYPSMGILAPPPPNFGRRKILLKLQEDRPQDKRGSFFFRRRSSRSFLYNNNSDFQVASELTEGIPRGQITVSWFEGTTTAELQEHVRNSVIRKMGHAKLTDLRILDETVDPPEEIVLSPFIPDGSEFLLRFTAKEMEETKLRTVVDRYDSVSAPDSPSAAPSPFPSVTDLADLNAKLLAQKLLTPQQANRKRMSPPPPPPPPENGPEDAAGNMTDTATTTASPPKKVTDAETASQGSRHDEDDVMDYSPEDMIEHRLRQLADLLIHEKKFVRRSAEKRQVVFVLANYFILFLTMVAVFAEIQARAPSWLNWVETQMESVQQCAMDQEALFECVHRGDFYGLIASFVLWLSRSAATKQFFLFGFKSSNALWTVVYESFVTAVCWGTSYMLIRRGMNPDTRKNFLRKYWKDAVYGSLAGFNASFMKQVLKNLIPQEALEDALQEALLQDRRLKIFSWLPSFKSN